MNSQICLELFQSIVRRYFDLYEKGEIDKEIYLNLSKNVDAIIDKIEQSIFCHNKIQGM